MSNYLLLSNIDSPADLRKLPVEKLPEVCRELREDIVKEVAVNPGHLASSLGVTELTVALHYVFNTPYDRIVWDVGHQAYGHKILTGRRDTFCTNRKLGGIHPFPDPAESEYDTFTCGHASNSISAALGMAVAAKLDSSSVNRKVVAVIGDGAMSGGLAFEGLNNVSSSPNDLLIILNDNNMSIDRSVGGMKQYLLDLNTNESYNHWRNKAAMWLREKGLLDENRRKSIIRFNNSVKALLSHQQNVFEGLNIRYFGPVDGHNIGELVRILRQLKEMSGPKLLHIHTVKGKGYKPAEEKPTIWHAPGKFDPETGERIGNVNDNVNDNDNVNVNRTSHQHPTPNTQHPTPKFQDVFGETIIELAEKNPRIVGITPAMPTGCSLNKMMAVMPDRAFDVGIAEGHAVTFSGGMAKDGLVPFCNIYSAFAQRAYDNIIHDVAIARLNVVFCFDRAGLVGEDGATHHGAFDMAALRPVPNLTISSPMDECELRRLMYTAQQPDMGPFVIRYPRGCGSVADWRCPLEAVPVGKGRKIGDWGNADAPKENRVAVLTIGPVGKNAEKALNQLYADTHEGSSVTSNSLPREGRGGASGGSLFDMRFLKPLDEEILHEVGKNYGRVVTVEDGVRNGGLGSAVMEWLSDNGYGTKVTRLGMPDHFVEHGTVAQLQHIIGIDVEGIADAIAKKD